MEVKNLYGTIETNPISGPEYHNEELEYISWEELKSMKNIQAERLRLVSDTGYPTWDCSYFYINVDNRRYSILNHPFYQLKKKGLKTQIYNILKEEGIFIKGIFDSISTLN